MSGCVNVIERCQTLIKYLCAFSPRLQRLELGVHVLHPTGVPEGPYMHGEGCETEGEGCGDDGLPVGAVGVLEGLVNEVGAKV